MKIKFKNQTSQKICESYLNRVERVTRVLSKEGQKDVLLEIESHIYESLSQREETNENYDEVETLVEILDKLGEPEEFLVEIVAERKMKEAVKSANPVVVLHSLWLNLSRGGTYILLLLFYLLIIYVVQFIPRKLIYPENVGLFSNEKSGHLGYLKNTAGYNELLGWWIIPAAIIIALIIYFGIIFWLKKLIKSKS